MSRTEPRPDRPIATVRRTRAVAAQWIVVSVLGFFAAAYAFGHVLAAIRGVPLEPIVVPVFAPPDVGVWLVASLGLAALVVVPHELLHGAFMARYGGDPDYGVGITRFLLPYAYAETEGASYTRNEMLVVALAPFVGVTAAGIAAMVVVPMPWLLVPLAANAAGSIGDLWTAGVLLQYPPTVRVAEPPERGVRGFGIYGASGRPPRPRPGMRLLSTVVSGAVGTAAALSTALVAAVFRSLAGGGGTVVIADPGGRWLLFRHELAAGEVHLEIGAALFCAVAVAGGVAWALVLEAIRALKSAG